EVLDALSLGVFSQAELLSLLAAFPGEVILTGHSCPPGLLAAADYVTHMSAQKHPYTTRSLPGRAGIEW
ncbi:MAG: cob(I)yrinic acid a,c-diamide adenosyltransferase, partial [Christensenellaceae bacterium]|nr:cob(I)yrinic acid a,c-diamide adenosyltransferase [Christensenellaceae bacterium]